MASKPYDMDRLGGPPGLYDSGNRDRASDCRIVQRIRVPAEADAGAVYPEGRFNTLSLNDSDSAVGPDAYTEEQKEELAKLKQSQLESGVPFRKPLFGDEY